MAGKKSGATNLTVQQFFKLAEGGKGLPTGRSPGGAAALLSCSRARITQLIEKGELRAYRVYDGDDSKRVAFILINEDDIAKWRERAVDVRRRRAPGWNSVKVRKRSVV